MLFLPSREIIRPYDKPSFEHTQRYGLRKGDWSTDGLVGLWLMNEGTGNIAQDLSGNGNAGTLFTDTTWASGKFGPCLNVPGTPYSI